MDCVRLLVGFALLTALGCGDGVTRLDGEGCQPACSTIASEGDSPSEVFSLCVDEDAKPDICVTQSEDIAICATGAVSCESGSPVCADGTRPTCGR